MSAFSHSYVLSVLLPPARRLDAAPKRWCRLSAGFFDPYRPELHYMRGPGPKWREKHQQAPGLLKAALDHHLDDLAGSHCPS